MGKFLLERKSASISRDAASEDEELALYIDRIISMATKDRVTVALVLCRIDDPGFLQDDADSQPSSWILKALRQLFLDISSHDWFFVQDIPYGFLSVIADKPRDRVEFEIRYLHETWKNLCKSQNPFPAISWGMAMAPDDAADRIALMRAAEASWYLAKRNGGGRIGTYIPKETVRTELELQQTQYERLQECAEREGVETGELIQEAVDMLIRRNTMQTCRV